MNPQGAGADADQCEGGAEADGEPFDSHFASDTDVSEETLHLSASTGGPSLTVKKKVKNRLTGDNQYKNDDQVIDDALELLYLQFKKEKLV